MYVRWGKRVLDLVVVLGSLPLWGLISIWLAVPVLLFIGRPVLFRQRRPGHQARPFTLMKFRTMTESRDEGGFLLNDERRLTQLGRWLRRTSLDEIPSLWNVLKGEMSLVGPRPLLVEYLERYTPEQARRHEVKPGITGWAQIKGRNALTWEDKFALDVWYVDHLCFSVDLKILLLTVRKVLGREGISAEGYSTMPEFTGGDPSERSGGKKI